MKLVLVMVGTIALSMGMGWPAYAAAQSLRGALGPRLDSCDDRRDGVAPNRPVLRGLLAEIFYRHSVARWRGEAAR